MSDESSRQQHPEADLLAGFAESSLTQTERESVLSHLAICARCRQVVFLAHQVEPAPEPASPAAPHHGGLYDDATRHSGDRGI